MTTETQPPLPLPEFEGMTPNTSKGERMSPVEIREKDVTDKLLYDVLYEYARKAGLDDTDAVDWALGMQSSAQRSVSNAGGNPDNIPEE